MTNKVEKANFKLSKAKVIRGGGLDIHFTTITKNGNEVYEEDLHVKCVRTPHPDLMACIHALKPVVARVVGITNAQTVVNSREFGASKGQADMIGAATKHQIESLEISGVTITGDKEKKGVIITALITAENKQKMCINTHKILLAGSSYGFEEELEDTISELESEVYEYYYNGKEPQMSIFDGESDEMPDVDDPAENDD